MPWRLVWSLSATQIVAWGTVYYAFGVLLVPMQAEFGWAQSVLTGAYSMALGIAALVLVPTGVWIDRRGGRAAMTAGSLLAVVLFVLLAVNDSLIGFYLIWAGLGLVMATTLYEAAFAVIEIGFGPAYRKGITVLTFAGGLASTVFIPITQWLVEVSGWRGAAFGLAVANLLVCVPLHALLPGRRAVAGRDSQHGEAGAGSAAENAAAAKASAAMAIRRALASLQFWTLAIAYTGYALVVGTLGVHLIPLLGAKGFSTGEVVLIASMVGPMQVAGRLAQYGLGDAVEVRRLSRIVFAMIPVAMAILLLSPAQSLFIGFFVVFYGVGMGISTILRGIAMPELFGRENYATLSNLLSAPSVAARAVAPFLASLIVAAFDTYEALIWANLVIALAALGAMWIATRRKADRS
ncbi:MAG: MFS transporter [Betaproteobacteria bacterium]|nr:MFS transporter [Betaproteobacteria bacterium]